MNRGLVRTHKRVRARVHMHVHTQPRVPMTGSFCFLAPAPPSRLPRRVQSCFSVYIYVHGPLSIDLPACASAFASFPCGPCTHTSRAQYATLTIIIVLLAVPTRVFLSGSGARRFRVNVITIKIKFKIIIIT